MTAIDRYLVLVYIRVLLVSFMSLVGLYIVIDGVNNMDEFWNYGDHHLIETAKVLAAYYTPRMLQFFDKTAGLLAMLSAAFVLTGISRSNELTALMAAGISPARVIRPLLFASLFVALLGAANREFGLPQRRDALSLNAQNWRGEIGRKCTPKYDIRTDILVSGQYTFANQKRLANPLFSLPDDFIAWGRRISADNAHYHAATPEHPAGYLLQGVKQPTNLAQLGSCSLAGKPVLYSPSDTPWLNPNECFVASIVTFEQLSIGGSWQNNLSTSELVTGLRGQMIEPGAGVRLTLHSRFVKPLLDMSLVLLGIPLVLSRGSRNIFIAAVLGLGLVAAVSVVNVACDALGRNYLLSATVAAWLPALVFAPLAFTVARPLWD